MPQDIFHIPPRMQVFVKNVSASNFTIVEFGGFVLHAGEEIDLTDPAAEHHYNDDSTAWKALNVFDQASLYKGLHAIPPNIAVRYVPAR